MRKFPELETTIEENPNFLFGNRFKSILKVYLLEFCCFLGTTKVDVCGWGFGGKDFPASDCVPFYKFCQHSFNWKRTAAVGKENQPAA